MVWDSRYFFCVVRWGVVRGFFFVISFIKLLKGPNLGFEGWWPQAATTYFLRFRNALVVELHRLLVDFLLH